MAWLQSKRRQAAAAAAGAEVHGGPPQLQQSDLATAGTEWTAHLLVKLLKALDQAARDAAAQALAQVGGRLCHSSIARFVCHVAAPGGLRRRAPRPRLLAWGRWQTKGRAEELLDRTA